MILGEKKLQLLYFQGKQTLHTKENWFSYANCTKIIQKYILRGFLLKHRNRT